MYNAALSLVWRHILVSASTAEVHISMTELKLKNKAINGEK
jgi:hypothetical protein